MRWIGCCEVQKQHDAYDGTDKGGYQNNTPDLFHDSFQLLRGPHSGHFARGPHVGPDTLFYNDWGVPTKPVDKWPAPGGAVIEFAGQQVWTDRDSEADPL